MFKLENYNTEKKNIIAVVYNNRNNPKKMITMETTNNKIKNTSNKQFINKELRLNPKQCPFCKKELSNKYNVRRHIKDTCPYNKIEQIDDNINEIILKSGKIKSQFPNRNLRDIIYIAGPQGAGKSTYVKNYVDEFLKIFPTPIDEIYSSSDESFDIVWDRKKQIASKYNIILDESEESSYSYISEEFNDDGSKYIYLLSRINNDESFKDYIDDETIIPVELSEEIINDPLDAKREMNNSLIIFDDYELLDKKIQKSVEITLKDVILNGRDQSNSGCDIYCAITSHQIYDYQRTRDILYECSSITFFPLSCPTYAIKTVLKKICGCSKSCIDKILSLDSRWITYYKRYPHYVLHEKGCFIPF